jgi:hypothetical protein
MDEYRNAAAYGISRYEDEYVRTFLKRMEARGRSCQDDLLLFVN